MKHEISCGAVVFTIDDGTPKYLLVKDLKSVCGFPKGHMEKGESEEETALREIREETGIAATLINGFRVTDEYLISARHQQLSEKEHLPSERDTKHRGTEECKGDIYKKGNIYKTVVFFLAEYDGSSQSIAYQKEELSDAISADYLTALSLITHGSTKAILQKAHAFITKRYKQQ